MQRAIRTSSSLTSETVEGRIQRFLMDLQSLVGHLCWIRSEIAHPCIGLSDTTRRISMSSVPRIMSVCAFGAVLLTFQGDLLSITGRSNCAFL